MDIINNQSSTNAAEKVRKLKSKFKSQNDASRLYSIQFKPDVGGLNPNADSSHGKYMRSFCDDSATMLAESILKHYSSKPLTREWSPLTSEIVQHTIAVREMNKIFAGRENILNSIIGFIESPEKRVLVVYGNQNNKKWH